MRQGIPLAHHSPHLLERLLDFLRRRSTGDPKSVLRRSTSQPTGTLQFEKVNRRVLERVIASSLLIDAKRSKCAGDKRQIDHRKYDQEPWQKEDDAADRIRRCIGEYQRSQHEELNEERDGRSP